MNAKSALKLGQVRGVALLAAAQRQLPVAEYRATQYKVVSCGIRTGEKGTSSVHGRPAPEPAGDSEPADAADALAIAICHLHTAQTLALQEAGDGDRVARTPGMLAALPVWGRAGPRRAS